MAKMITKKHKLYFRTNKGVIRRLDKTAPQLYGLILSAFISGGAEKEYQELNKDVKSWQGFKPIKMIVPDDHKISFKILKHAVGGNPKSIVISYNGSWRPLVELRLADVLESIKKKKEQKPEQESRFYVGMIFTGKYFTGDVEVTGIEGNDLFVDLTKDGSTWQEVWNLEHTETGFKNGDYFFHSNKK